MNLSSKLVLGALLVFIGFMSVADLFYRPGHPITFDGHIHMTTMNQYAQSLYDGEFPVTWANNFANYGHPLPILAHQLPAYIGAIFILLGISTEFSYTLVLVLSILVCSILYFIFFQKLARNELAFAATVLSVFFPYKVLNIYTRGGLPEIVASVFLPILLLGIWQLKQKKNLKAIALLFWGTFCTAISHPMMLLVFFIPVLGFLLFSLDKIIWKKQVFIAGLAASLGILSASFYLIPLLVESRYFYQSRAQSSIVTDSFLTVKQLYDPSWAYTASHPGPRGNYIKLGCIEFIIVLTALLTLLQTKIFKIKSVSSFFDNKEHKNLLFWTGISVLLIFLLLSVSKIIYLLPIINQIQYPWRFLGALQLTIPVVFIYTIKSIKHLQSNYFLLVFIACVVFFRTPQFYGKNYISQPESDYYFTQSNLHSTNFNTVWSDNSENYKKKSDQAEIIEGNGTLEIIELKNASRKYRSISEFELRLLDYTFYFPGWTVYIDGIPTTIQYQDPNYRGLITYTIPPGTHDIQLIYNYSKIRLFALILSGSSLIASIVFYILLATKKLKIS